MKKKSQLIILGAGKPHKGSYPSSLTEIDNGQDVLAWILQSFQSVELEDIRFIGGFKVNQIIERYPHINYNINPQWKESKSLRSLLIAPQDLNLETYVSYSDVIYPKTVVEKLSDITADIVLVGDSLWKTRYGNRGSTDMQNAEKYRCDNGRITTCNTQMDIDDASGEFIGLAKFSNRGIDLIQSFKIKSHADQLALSFCDLIQQGIEKNLDIKLIDVKGDWAEINQASDIAHFVMKTKAKALERLKPMLKQSTIFDQINFTVSDWNQDKASIVKDIQDAFMPASLIVRSSALVEDQLGQSMAGAFESILNIDSTQSHDIETSIQQVIQSYPNQDQQNQILIQKMAKNIKKVVFFLQKL